MNTNTSIRDDLKEMTRSGWMLASWAVGTVSVLTVATLFITPRALWGWTCLAERLNPGVDAPDNWALGITYCMKTAFMLYLTATGLAAVGLWRLAKRRKGRITSPMQPTS